MVKREKEREKEKNLAHNQHGGREATAHSHARHTAGCICRRKIENQIVYGTHAEYRSIEIEIFDSVGQQQRAAQRDIEQGEP